VYSTYFGGSRFDEPFEIVDDEHGCPIVSGHTYLGHFPTTSGAYDSVAGLGAYFISKFNARGDSFIFSTLFPRHGNDLSDGTVVPCSDGSVYFVAATRDGWPLTTGAFDTVCQGVDVGVARLSGDGSNLEYGSYLGGTGDDYRGGCAVDALSRLYVSGLTHSSDFPRTSDALFDTAMYWGGGFLSIFDPRRSAITYSTLYHGCDAITSIRVVAPGDVWILALGDTSMPVTTDALQRECPSGNPGVDRTSIAHLDLNARRISYASFFYYGSGNSYFLLNGFEVDDSERVRLYGYSGSSDFPMPLGGYDSTPPSPGTFKSFVMELQLPATIAHGTYLGAESRAGLEFMRRTTSGAILLAGEVRNDSFPTTPDAFDRHYNGGYNTDNAGDAVFCILSPHLDSLRYSTYLGGSQADHAAGVVASTENSIWISGYTASGDFPATANAYQTAPAGCFLTRFDLSLGTGPEPQSALVPDQISVTSFPNPFNPTTTLIFTLPKMSNVQLEVFDILGRSVYAVDLGRMNAGSHQHMFDGSALASGVYFAKVKAGGLSAIEKILLIR
jgi:hypothetical protein